MSIGKCYEDEVKCGGCNYRVMTLYAKTGQDIDTEGVCSDCFLANEPTTPSPDFTNEDWVEAYHALVDKYDLVKQGVYGEEGKGERRWRDHLSEIIDKLEIFFGEADITY